MIAAATFATVFLIGQIVLSLYDACDRDAVVITYNSGFRLLCTCVYTGLLTVLALVILL